MKILLNEVLYDTEKNVIKDDNGNLKLKKILINSVFTEGEHVRNESAEEKAKRAEIGYKLINSDESLEVEAEDIALLKKLSTKVMTALISGQVSKLLENKPNPLAQTEGIVNGEKV